MSISESLSIRFDSLQELEHWHQSRDSIGVIDEFRIPKEKIGDYNRSRENDGKTDLKVMVCHDYKGNYVPEEDESPIGYFPHSSGHHYFIQYPSLVDIFIYFSHHRVAVPPVSWINSLHKQGVQVLGTLLIEGTQHKLLDELVLRDPSDGTKFKYVAALVDLARHYEFDGWLVNIESVFSVNTKSKEILLFVEQLKSEIHRAIPGSQIVWYDAFISSKNRIFYQNGVNEYNYDHFESSDLFFTNYWWDENTLRQNILNVGLQGVKNKLYTGIDIWGRGSKVGHGGFETGVAINFLRVYSSNVALFAPAWTYEHFGEDQFISKDQQFWIDEEKSPGGSISTYIPFSTTPVYIKDGDVNFYTNFSQGEGSGFNVLGLNIYDDKWVNGSLQTSVPSSLEEGYLEITKDEKFNGGSALQVTLDPLENGAPSRSIELFKFKNDIESKALNVSVSYKSLVRLPSNSKLILNIKYYIERRFRSVTKVRDGVFEVPLKLTKDWKVSELSFTLPRLQVREHFVLSGVELIWKPEGDIDQSWIYVSDEVDSGKKHHILLGDLLVESVHLKRSTLSIKRVSKTVLESTDEIFVKWEGQDQVLYWIVYVNSRFVNATSSPCWVLNKGDRLRVDCFTRSATIITGQDIFI